MKESTKLRTDPKQAAELSPKAAKQPAPKHHTPLKRRVEPYIWLLPSIVMMGVLILIPIITVFQTSFSEISKAGVFKGFNGVDNYLWIFKQPAFRTTLKNTVVWTVVVVGLSTILGIVLGLVLNEKFHGRKIVRAIVVFPWATALIIQSVVWKYIINADYGALNNLLYNLGIIKSYVNWTATPQAFFAWECFEGILVTVPFITFCVLSGLQSIDASYYEAATVDGAGYFQKLFSITLPLVKSSLTVATVLNIIYVFNSFPIIWTMTKGDPANHTDTLVTYLYKLAFYNGKQGEASAVSVIGFIILLACASVYMIYTLRKGDDEL